MINIENNISFEDEFIVVDEDDNPVTGLTQGDFTVLLYNPSGAEVSGSVTTTISEIGNGIYKILFTPNKLGNWELLISNPTYFPWSKYGHYKSVKATNDKLFDYLERIVGLSQENFRIFNSEYNRAGDLTQGIIKIYENANDVDTDTNPIATYEVITSYGKGKYNRNVVGYKVKKTT